MSVNYARNKSKGSYVELKLDIDFEELFLETHANCSNEQFASSG